MCNLITACVCGYYYIPNLGGQDKNKNKPKLKIFFGSIISLQVASFDSSLFLNFEFSYKDKANYN